MTTGSPFRFPFSGGVTKILLGASTYQLVGYVRGSGISGYVQAEDPIW
jgi:hypothetical protein